jgi:hypothetical protein
MHTLRSPAAAARHPAAARADERSQERPDDRPPKALKPRKARCAGECERLEQLPNIGPSLAADLRLLGLQQPRELSDKDPFALYQLLCARTGKRQDPCVLDTFIAATEFMRGADPKPWWTYTAQRKALYGTL